MAKSNRVVPRECTGQRKHPLPTTQGKTHGHHQMVNTKIRLIIFFVAKDGEVLYSQQKQDWDLTVAHELLIAKFRLKLKKVGKTTRPFRYDINQILHDYTVEVTNRFKVLDLMDRVSEELWMEVCDIVQEAGIETIPKTRNAKRQNGSIW